MRFLSLVFLFIGLNLSSYGYNGIGTSFEHKKTLHSKSKELNLKERLVFGGGFSFRLNPTFLNISPRVGYKITDKFYAGIGLGYSYLKIKKGMSINNMYGGQKRVDISQNILNGNLWTQYNVFKYFVVGAQFEINSWDYYYQPEGGYNFDAEGWRVLEKKHKTIPSLLLGGGVNYRIAHNFGVYIMLSYDVLQASTKDSDGNKQSPYADILDYRIGVHFNL